MESFIKKLFIGMCVSFICVTAVCAQVTTEDMKKYNDYHFIPNFATKDNNVFRIMDSAAILTPKKYPISIITMCVDGYEVVIVSQANGSSSFQLTDMNGNGIMCKRY